MRVDFLYPHSLINGSASRDAQISNRLYVQTDLYYYKPIHIIIPSLIHRRKCASGFSRPFEIGHNVRFACMGYSSKEFASVQCLAKRIY